MDQVVHENEIIEEDEDECFFQDIDELQNHGIGASDLTKLKAAGICTVKAVVMTTKRSLAKVKGLSEPKVEKLKEAAGKLQAAGFITAFEYAMRRKCIVKITTGSVELDNLIGGGIQTMCITEAFGEFRTGKTQIAHTLCITAQLPSSLGGGNGKAAFIDTEGTFRPDRLKAIAERFNLDPEICLENIAYARAFNSEHQMELITELTARFAEERGVYRVLIVDSIIALFRTDFSGRGELSERQQKLGTMLARLQRVSEEFNVAIFITNQMTADPGAGLTFVPDPKKPVGGNILAHASTIRLSLRKGRGETRVAKVYDSPDMPEAEAGGGIMDPKE